MEWDTESETQLTRVVVEVIVAELRFSCELTEALVTISSMFGCLLADRSIDPEPSPRMLSPLCARLGPTVAGLGLSD